MENDLKEIIQFAINEEKSASELYEKYADITNSASTRKMLKSMAAMEYNHENRLKKFIETEKSFLMDSGNIKDIHISDFLVTPELNENSDIQEVFIYAMKAEEKAFELYTKLVNSDVNSAAKHLFESLAAEEKKHKMDLEIEYEKHFMPEN